MILPRDHCRARRPCLHLTLVVVCALVGCEEAKEARSLPIDVFVGEDDAFWVVGVAEQAAVDGGAPESAATVELFPADGSQPVWERELDAAGAQRLDAYAPLFNRTFLFAGADDALPWVAVYGPLGALAWQRAWSDPNGSVTIRRAVELPTVDVFLAGNEVEVAGTRAMWASVSPDERTLNWARRAATLGSRTIELFPLEAHAALLVGEIGVPGLGRPFVATLARDGDVVSSYEANLGLPVETTDAFLVGDDHVVLAGRSGAEEDPSGIFVASMSILTGALRWTTVHELQQGRFGDVRVAVNEERVVVLASVQGYGSKPDTDVDILIAFYSREGDLVETPVAFGSRDLDVPLHLAVASDESVDAWVRIDTQVQRRRVTIDGLDDACGRSERVNLVRRGVTTTTRAIDFAPLALDLAPAELRVESSRRFADRFFLCRP